MPTRTYAICLEVTYREETTIEVEEDLFYPEFQDNDTLACEAKQQAINEALQELKERRVDPRNIEVLRVEEI